MKHFLNYKFFLLLNLFLGLTLLFLAPAAQAAYQIEIGLPNLPADSSAPDPGTYVRYLFIFGLSLAGFLAVGAIALGGINYMLAGSISSVEKAKSLIIGALSGVALLLCSWLLLRTIDPSLTNLSPLPQGIRVGDIAAPSAAPPAVTPAPPVMLDFSWHCPDEGGGLYANQNECNNSCVAACIEQGPGP